LKLEASRLNNIYLVRHGQAGTRDNYDSLSDLGQRQASLLGEWFVTQGIEFVSAFTGSMNRQQQTAAAVRSAYARFGRPFPEVIVDEQWNEFDLTDIYRVIGPQLCEVDEEFRLEFEELRREVRESHGVADAKVHRHWRPCDTKMVEAWIGGKFRYEGETWVQFRQRVAQCIFNLDGAASRANVLISTSATPTGVVTGLALGIEDPCIRQLAGVLYNSSFTTLRLRNGQLQLFQFNAVPHLASPELRTHR
jgi:broad specificity phosphatase PhoE